MAAGVDLHCHVLPGVDDGAETMEESVEYCRIALDRGTGTIVATPHVELVEVRELPRRVDELRAALRHAGVDVRIEVGGELRPESVSTMHPDELEILAHGPPGARWLLFEVPFTGVDEPFLDAAAELRARGYALLLAHPERTRGLLEGGLLLLDGLLRDGALLEVNVAPLVGHEEVARTKAARYLVEQGLAHVVATDAHPWHRSYQLADAAPFVPRSAFTEAPARLLHSGFTRPGEPDGRWGRDHRRSARRG